MDERQLAEAIHGLAQVARHTLAVRCPSGEVYMTISDEVSRARDFQAALSEVYGLIAVRIGSQQCYGPFGVGRPAGVYAVHFMYRN